MNRYTHTMCMAFGADGEADRVEVDATFDYLVAGSAVSDIRVLKIDGRGVTVADADLHDRIHDDLASGRFDDLLISLVTPSPVGGGYDASDVRYGLHLIANEDCDEVAASYYAKKALAHLAAPAPSSLAGGEVMRLVPDRVLTEALYWMARGYERVHSMPRVSDTELASKIEAAKADLGRARDASPALSVPIQQESV